MKKRLGKLSKAEQERSEMEYHQMKPDQFDEQMAKAKKHVADSVRLPREMVETLKVVAELEGERDCQTMVRKWIEERLQQEARVALRISKLPTKKDVAVLKRQVTKRGAERRSSLS
jgi:hypothetical protein